MQRGKKAWIIHLEAITFNDDTFMIMALSVESKAVGSRLYLMIPRKKYIKRRFRAILHEILSAF